MCKSALLLKRLRVVAQSGAGFRVRQGQVLRVIDVDGEQVVDMFVGVAACAVGACKNFSWTPQDIEIFDHRE